MKLSYYETREEHIYIYNKQDKYLLMILEQNHKPNSFDQEKPYLAIIRNFGISTINGRPTRMGYENITKTNVTQKIYNEL